jgi:NAD(P)H-hydrate epimerase
MGDTGVNVGAVAAELTVTFFRKKPGHLLQPAKHLCGELVVADIGTPISVLYEKAQNNQQANKAVPSCFENHPDLWRDALPLLNQEGNKYTRGHALVWGGWPTTGAARLSATAAARIGAGLTTVAVDVSQSEAALIVYATTLVSIMVTPVAKLQDLEVLLADIRITGLLIGPGASVSEETQTRVLAMLKSGKPTVLDAGALSAFKEDPQQLFSSINGVCVLTPHEGEFTRVFPSIDPCSDKLNRARNAAKISGAIVVLKGNDTVIAAPDGRAIINTNAPATLATAGTGDVLAGIILGLLTQGMEPFLATAAAVWLHGEAANDFGVGLLAEDLPEQLPRVLQQIKKF